MATATLFDKAKVIEAKPTAGKKAKKVTTLIEGLEVYAAVCHLAKWLKALAETTKPTNPALESFIAQGIAKKGAPASFDAEEGKGTSNVQCKKRSTASGLNDIEQALASEYSVPTETVSDRPETYIFNPAHADWLQKNAAKVSAALVKLGAPEDVIQYQEATTKVVTTEDSIDFVFRTYHKRPEVIATLLPVVSTITFGAPKFDGGGEKANETALDTIKNFLGEAA